MVCEWRLGKMRICNTQSTIDGIHICMLQCNAMDSRNIYRIYKFWARWMLRVGDREMGWFLLSLGEPQSKPCGLSLPSGKRLHNCGKSQFLMGKSTIYMAIFNSYVSLPEGMFIIKTVLSWGTRSPHVSWDNSPDFIGISLLTKSVLF